LRGARPCPELGVKPTCRLNARTSHFVEGFGCRPIAALRLGPRPASESRQGRNPREMSGGGAASAALWIFVYDGSACWQPTLMSVLSDDVAAHDGSVAGR
jgi:hypothetical protein